MSEPILCSVDENKALESCDFGRKWGGPARHSIIQERPQSASLAQMVNNFYYWESISVWTPYQIESYAEYIRVPRYTGPSNPCGEISLGKPELCQLGVRKIATPFNLESFRELYVVDCIGFCKPFYVTGMLNEASRDFLSRSRQLQALLSTSIE